MSRRHRSAIQTKAEMNLTPMMDLTFLLLITFIITFPLIEQGIPVNLPRGKAPVTQTEAKPAIVSVDKDGRLFLGSDPVTLDELEHRLRRLYTENTELSMTLRGDAKVHYGAIVDVARLATQIGIKRLAMATQE